MGDGQEADERAVLKELQDFRLVCQTPEDHNNTNQYFYIDDKSNGDDQ